MSKRLITILLTVFTVMLLTGCNGDQKAVSETAEGFLTAMVNNDLDAAGQYASEEFMNSEKALDLYTRGFYNAFVRYKNKYDEGMSVPYRVEKVDRVEIPQVVQNVSEPQVQSAPKTEPVKKEVKKTESVKKSEPVKKEKNSEVQNAKAKVQNVSPDAPVFKIQIMAGHSDLSVTSSHFKGIGGIEKIKEGDFYRYYVEASNDYNAVNRRRKELSEVFPGCYIVAFKHGKLVNVNEAIKEFLKSRNKK